MRATLFLLPCVLLSAACAPMEAEPQGADDALPSVLAGRTPGEPRDCIPIQPGRSMSAVDRGLVTIGSGETIWQVRFRDGCPSVRRLDTLLVEPTGNQYCRGDRVRAITPSSSIPGPICIIESFIPFTRSE